jgi:hypothetical protein
MTANTPETAKSDTMSKPRCYWAMPANSLTLSYPV